MYGGPTMYEDEGVYLEDISEEEYERFATRSPMNCADGLPMRSTKNAVKI